jgi:hypothetical protein
MENLEVSIIKDQVIIIIKASTTTSYAYKSPPLLAGISNHLNFQKRFFSILVNDSLRSYLTTI